MTRQLNPTKHSKYTVNEIEIFLLSFQTVTVTPTSAISSALPTTNPSPVILKPLPSSELPEANNSPSHGEQPFMKKELLITIAFLTGFVAVVVIVGSLVLVIKCCVKSKKSRPSSKYKQTSFY